jgi:protein-tyrosine sulfotransferase
MNNSHSLSQFPRPIFILGILPRSGTNFLHQLICLHPDCTPTIFWEDFLTYPATLLDAYAHAVYQEWMPVTTAKIESVIESPIDCLLRHLGDGLISLLYNQQLPSKRVVTKTPWVRNLPYVFKLFPNAQLLILIRDGRSVVESGARSFYWDYRSAMQQWAEAAETILQFQQDYAQDQRYLIVKYEDLYLNTVEIIQKILGFLNLDPQRYNFSTALNSPVLGSSDLRHNQLDSPMHWQPIDKSSSFTPLDRWQDWDQEKHTVFNQIAGAQMLQMGYSLQGQFIPSPVLQSTGLVPDAEQPRSNSPSDALAQTQALLNKYQQEKTHPIELRSHPELRL